MSEIKQIKISDCIAQAQPFMEKEVLDTEGNTIAILKALTFADQMKANSYAIQKANISKENLEKASTGEDEIKWDGDFAIELMIKSLSLSIVKWCFDVEPTPANINLVAQLKPKLFNLILTAFNQNREKLESISKN